MLALAVTHPRRELRKTTQGLVPDPEPEKADQDRLKLLFQVVPRP